MKNIYFQISFIFFISVMFFGSLSQSEPSVRLISSEVFFIETKQTISPNRHYTGSDKILHVITTYTNHYYSLKFSIIIDEHIVFSETPLDIRLVTPSNKIITRRIEKSISDFKLGEIYYYDLEIILNETGWHTLEIGEFSKDGDGETTNISYDKNQLYVRK